MKKSLFKSIALAIGAITASLTIHNRRPDVGDFSPSGLGLYRQNKCQGKGKGRRQASRNTTAMVKQAAIKIKNIHRERSR